MTLSFLAGEWNLFYYLALKSKANIYVLFRKSTKSVRDFRCPSHSLSTFAVVMYRFYDGNARKGDTRP